MVSVQYAPVSPPGLGDIALGTPCAKTIQILCNKFCAYTSKYSYFQNCSCIWREKMPWQGASCLRFLEFQWYYCEYCPHFLGPFKTFQSIILRWI